MSKFKKIRRYISRMGKAVRKATKRAVQSAKYAAKRLGAGVKYAAAKTVAGVRYTARKVKAGAIRAKDYFTSPEFRETVSRIAHYVMLPIVLPLYLANRAVAAILRRISNIEVERAQGDSEAPLASKPLKRVPPTLSAQQAALRAYMKKLPPQAVTALAAKLNKTQRRELHTVVPTLVTLH